MRLADRGFQKLHEQPAAAAQHYATFYHVVITLRAKLRGAVYCNRSCLTVCLWLRGWVCYHDNSKLRASILTKLGVKVVTISSWLHFGRPASPGRGSAAGRNFRFSLASAQCLRLRALFSFRLWPKRSARAIPFSGWCSKCNILVLSNSWTSCPSLAKSLLASQLPIGSYRTYHHILSWIMIIITCRPLPPCNLVDTKAARMFDQAQFMHCEWWCGVVTGIVNDEQWNRIAQ